MPSLKGKLIILPFPRLLTVPLFPRSSVELDCFANLITGEWGPVFLSPRAALNSPTLPVQPRQGKPDLTELIRREKRDC